MNAPSKLHCETHDLISRCNRPHCPYYEPGRSGVPLATLPLCGRVAEDVARMNGGFTQAETAWVFGVSLAAVKQTERRALRKVRLAMGVV